jgi:hypothetical protein
MGRKEPLDDERVTQGICPPCSAQILQALAREHRKDDPDGDVRPAVLWTGLARA